MMRLSVMRAFFATVDRDWRSPVIDQILTHWEHDPGSGFILRASANFIAVYQAGGARRILRFVHPEQRSLAEIESELAFITHLAARGIPVARPVPARNGALALAVESELGAFCAAAFEALDGEQREIDQLDEEGFVVWGRALGELHAAAQGFGGEGRPGWREHLEWAESLLLARDPVTAHIAARLRDKLEGLPVTAENFGVIHYDFELDNLLWKDGRVGVVDFDDCARYWYAADVAYALRDLCDDRASRVDLGDSRLQAFVRGYRGVRPLPDEELARLPLMLRLLNLHKYCQLSAICAEPPGLDEPEWLEGLRQRLRAKIAVYRDDFLL